MTSRKPKIIEETYQIVFCLKIQSNIIRVYNAVLAHDKNIFIQFVRSFLPIFVS